LEAKIERILRGVIDIQTKMNSKENKSDVSKAINKIRKEIGKKTDKILSNKMTELIENLASSSETLLEKL
jgi:uncharacterized transporter YbjL